MKIVKSAFALFTAVQFAGPAGAKTITPDGVVVFTQADVNAGGITPGDTPGFPASLLVSGNYRLGSPLTLTSLKNGIVISAPAVTLDLNGFKLSGASVGRSGVVSDQIDTTVGNGIIRGFIENGIQSGGQYLSVHDMRLTNNGQSGLVDPTQNDMKNARIVETVASGNGGYGISCGMGCLVRDSTVSENGSGGILMQSGRVQDNIVRANQGHGIQIAGTGNALGNLITDNSNYGLVGGSVGFGNNTIIGNSSAVSIGVVGMDPNICNVAC